MGNSNEYYILASKIHNDLLAILQMNETLKDIDVMLDDISRKIGPVEEVTWHELERRRNIQ
ncbi:MAG: hypothetical protein E7197_07720 [Anaerovibrio sp.]|uniref:hypothetical protein n=1 Tax=Anaerovibrio sp. TaxID=1872532 RepID=UPI0025BDC2CB|nr:hypothetical protein [Anaerovibrio sp.]MBE6099927.1 hypothetical protein [Anaerovibrio sp.]